MNIATTTQPKPMPSPMVMDTPARRSPNIWRTSRPFTRPARMVPSTEPAMMASTWIASRGTRLWRMFPAMVKNTMLV